LEGPGCEPSPAASQRATVDGEIASTRPRSTASAASSAALRRDRGTPCSAGSAQASALTSASVVAGKMRLRRVRVTSREVVQVQATEHVDVPVRGAIV
jgi:hypothetical protein